MQSIFNKTLNMNFNFAQGCENKHVFNLIMDEANNVVKENTEKIDLDGKIILSIAIRLLAEAFMIEEITKSDGNSDDVDEVCNKGANQTGLLLGLYKKKLPNESDIIRILDEVSLMTSENIHINSFMYEPIIDMSVIELILLYKRFQAICLT